MKIVIQDTQIIYNNKIYTRKQHNDDIVPIFNYFWYTNNHRVTRSVEEILEREYQKTLISIKTPNPSEKKGFESNNINEIIEILEMAQVCPNPHAYILNATTKLKKIQANGEKPEEVNPVGQVDLIAILKRAKEENMRHNTIDVDFFLTTLMIELRKINKPLETIKEQPECDPKNCINACAIYGCQKNPDNQY